MFKDYDFSGYATKYNVRCTDGITIEPGTFEHQDGTEVPLLYQHNKTDIGNKLGKAYLEHRDDGVYMYGKFNSTTNGKNAKILVDEGEIKAMSINAVNVVKHSDDNGGAEVTEGDIREVSLVLFPANPGAKIENVIVHDEDGTIIDVKDDEFIITNGNNIEINHADSNNEESDEESDLTVGDVLDTLNDDQNTMLDAMINLEITKTEPDDEVAEAIKTVMDTCTDEQKVAIAMFMDEVAKDAEAADPTPEDDEGAGTVEQSDDNNNNQINHSNEGEDDNMANVFDKDLQEKQTKEYTELTHEDQAELFKSAQRSGMTLDGYIKNQIQADEDLDKRLGVTIAHAANGAGIEYGTNNMGGNPSFPTTTAANVGKDNKFAMGAAGPYNKSPYGFANAGYAMPEYKNINKMPMVIDDNYDWVPYVLGKTSKQPFMKIRTWYADITDDEMRARGYITGNLKKEQVYKLLRRSTDGTTIYVKQKMDKDMIYDITDFDAWMWAKSMMLRKLREEEARCILVGDGREVTDPDHVNAECIRPVYGDHELYTIYKEIAQAPATANPAGYSDYTNQLIEIALRARAQYRGTGKPTLFVSPWLLTTMLLSQDKLGHRLFKNEGDLKEYFRVSELHEVELFDTGKASRVLGEDEYASGSGWEARGEEGDVKPEDAIAVVQMLFVNLADYQVGVNKGGQVFQAEQFDLDYNQLKALMETRMSGSLMKPKAAIAMEIVGSKAKLQTLFKDRYHHPLEGVTPQAAE